MAEYDVSAYTEFGVEDEAPLTEAAADRQVRSRLTRVDYLGRDNYYYELLYGDTDGQEPGEEDLHPTEDERLDTNTTVPSSSEQSGFNRPSSEGVYDYEPKATTDGKSRNYMY